MQINIPRSFLSGWQDHSKQPSSKQLASAGSCAISRFSDEVPGWVAFGSEGFKFCDQSCWKGMHECYATIPFPPLPLHYTPHSPLHTSTPLRGSGRTDSLFSKLSHWTQRSAEQKQWTPSSKPNMNLFMCCPILIILRDVKSFLM